MLFHILCLELNINEGENPSQINHTRSISFEMIQAPHGGLGLIHCHIHGPVMWMFNGSELSADRALFISKRHLFVPDISECNEGVYYCFNETAAGPVSTVLELTHSM